MTLQIDFLKNSGKFFLPFRQVSRRKGEEIFEGQFYFECCVPISLNFAEKKRSESDCFMCFLGHPKIALS